MLRVDTNWRDTGRYPQLLGLDVRGLFPLLLVLLHISWVTVSLAAVASLVFGIMASRGVTPGVFMRMLRVAIVGPVVLGEARPQKRNTRPLQDRDRRPWGPLATLEALQRMGMVSVWVMSLLLLVLAWQVARLPEPELRAITTGMRSHPVPVYRQP